MDRIIIKASALIIFYLIISGGEEVAANTSVSGYISLSRDSAYLKQLLYNGRVWESKYLNIADHEFLSTRNCVSGDVTINDTAFKNILLRYDIYTDEVIVMIDQVNFVQLNREAVQDFTLTTPEGTLLFQNCDRLTNDIKIGYGEIIYKDRSSIIRKHYKKIKKLAVENKYDAFVYSSATYIINRGKCYRISTKKDLFKALSDRENEIKEFLHDEKIRIRIKRPETMISVLKFYDSLYQGELP